MKTVAALALLWIGVCQATPVQLDDLQLEDELRPFAPPELPFFPLLFPEQNEQSGSALWNSGKYQGDIVLNEEQERLIQLNSSERNAMRYEANTWIPVNKVIPFEFAPNVFTDQEKSNIIEWLKEFERNSCLTVRPRTNEADYVQIFNDPGKCYSRLGREGGMQQISLGRPQPGRGHCIWKSTVIHEFMHAAGFWHEQSRQDRDQYIRVAMENVRTNMRHNFNKAPARWSVDIGNYDYQSVMQYKSTAFSMNGEKTMIRRDGKTDELGQPTYGSFTKDDIYKLNKLYKCGNTGPVTPAPTTQAPTTRPTTQQPTTGSGSCVDKKGSTYCTRRTGYCNHSYKPYRDHMSRNCRKTCGACNQSTCEDIASNCNAYINFCSYSQPGDGLDRYCRKTCNKC